MASEAEKCSADTNTQVCGAEEICEELCGGGSGGGRNDVGIVGGGETEEWYGGGWRRKEEWECGVRCGYSGEISQILHRTRT